ncbi:MAG: DUF924 family protein [Bacillota bacterium]
MTETPASIHAFWFGAETDDALLAQERARLWWAKDAATDREIERRFAACVDQAVAGALDGWAATPRGRLALILLTDQFPRNIYRGTPRSFAYDRYALAWCKQGLAAGVHHALRPIERVFFYLPLEHSEAADDQTQAVALFEELVAQAGATRQAAFDGFLDYARRHRDVIVRFGRFPHRNQILGRQSSPDELAFLRQPGSSF